MTPAQLGTLAGLLPTTGSWSHYLRRLRERGYVAEADGRLVATGDGLAAVGRPHPAQPPAPHELLELWRSVLGEDERRILDRLVERYPAAVPRWEVAAAARLGARGGVFQQHVAALERAGLVLVTDDGLRAWDRLSAGAGADVNGARTLPGG